MIISSSYSPPHSPATLRASLSCAYSSSPSSSNRPSGRSRHESLPAHPPSASVSYPPSSAAPLQSASSSSLSASSSLPRPSPRSRLSQGIEEIRAALKRQTVTATSSPPEQEPARKLTPSPLSPPPAPGSVSDRSTTLVGGSSAGSDVKMGPSRSTSARSSTSTSTSTNNKESSGTGTVMDPRNPKSPVQVPRSQVSSGASRIKRTSSAAADQRLETVARDSLPAETDRDRSQSKRIRPARLVVKFLPRRYDRADPKDLVVLISSMLMELIRYNDKIPLHEGRLTRFHSRTPPRISVHDYLQRLTTHATLSPPILLSMVYYIDRLCALYPAFTVSSLTVHRFLIASATVASKGLSDSFWTNKTYARVGGISVAELALLELEFLWRVEWRIVPQPEVLVDYYLSLVERCEGYQLEPELPPSDLHGVDGPPVGKVDEGNA